MGVKADVATRRPPQRESRRHIGATKLQRIWPGHYRPEFNYLVDQGDPHRTQAGGRPAVTMGIQPNPDFDPDLSHTI